MGDEPSSQKKVIITFLAVVIVIVVIVAAVATATKDKSSSDTTTTSTTPSTSADSTPATSSTYKDGLYSAKGSYESPGGTESISIDVTLKDGVVTATSAKSGATDSEAEQYQSQFIAGYKQFVVGKNVNQISLSRVSGSSLTSQGFNEALTQIKNQAKA